MSKQLTILRRKRIKLQSEWEKADQVVDQIRYQINSIDSKICEITYREQIGEKPTLAKLMAYPYDKLRDDLYKQFHKWMWDNFKYVRVDGYHPETNQALVRVGFVKSDPFKPQYNELKKFLPYIEPINMVEDLHLMQEIAEENGVTEGVHVSIFEHTLSYSASWQLWIIKEKAYVVACTMHSLHRHFEGSIEEACKYIHQHVYYEDANSEDEDANSEDDDD